MGRQQLQFPIQETINDGLNALNNPNPELNIPVLLVSIGAPKLRSLGYKIERSIAEPEKKLYLLLAQQYPKQSPHSLYNSWIRRLVSFERAVACAK